MESTLQYVIATVLTGAGATAATDVWAQVRRRAFDLAPPDFGLVGRWLAQVLRGRLRPVSIAAVPAVNGERIIGWTAHYLIGIAFAALLPAFWGTAWLRQPAIGPAMLVGIATVAAPLLVMQPGMGAGIAASRTPRPNAARLQSLITHAVFGLGLYASGLAARYVGGA